MALYEATPATALVNASSNVSSKPSQSLLWLGHTGQLQLGTSAFTTQIRAMRLWDSLNSTALNDLDSVITIVVRGTPLEIYLKRWRVPCFCSPIRNDCWFATASFSCRCTVVPGVDGIVYGFSVAKKDDKVSQWKQGKTWCNNMVLKEGLDFLMCSSAVSGTWSLKMDRRRRQNAETRETLPCWFSLIDLDPAPGPNTAKPHWDCIGAHGKTAKKAHLPFGAWNRSSLNAQRGRVWCPQSPQIAREMMIGLIGAE